MRSQISFFNFYWKDLTNPSFEKLLNIAQVMDFIISEQKGKVLVHCHAGQGRTALVIAAYLIYSRVANGAEEAILVTRKHRPKCFSKGYNQKFIKMFDSQLQDLRVLFPSQTHKLSLPKLLS